MDSYFTLKSTSAPCSYYHVIARQITLNGNYSGPAGILHAPTKRDGSSEKRNDSDM